VDLQHLRLRQLVVWEVERGGVSIESHTDPASKIALNDFAVKMVHGNASQNVRTSRADTVHLVLESAFALGEASTRSSPEAGESARKIARQIQAK
jgi:hypothetical protein